MAEAVGDRVLSRRMPRVAGWGGAIALAVGVFAALTHGTVAGGRATAADRAILRWTAEMRTPPLTTIMVGVTRLGSPRPFTAITVAALAILIALRDRRGVLHLAAAGAGTWILEATTKNLVERTRPTEVAALLEASGYSYPSGHALAASALYLTMAILAARYLRARPAKALLASGTFLLIAAIGFSRIYLGVHYPTDVLSGVALGTAWALLLAAVIGVMAPHPASPRKRGEE